MQTTEKRAIEVDPMVAARYLTGGLVLGGSTAALLNLVRAIREARIDQKERTAPLETNENTIVLRLPKNLKHASLIKTVTESIPAVPPEPAQIKTVEGSQQGTYPMKSTKNGVQPRKGLASAVNPGHWDKTDKTDKYGSFQKDAAGWPTLTMAALSAVAGTTAGAAVVNKLFEMRRVKQLQRELDAAQQEYLDQLSHPKAAASNIFGHTVPLDKQADSTFGTLNYPLAAMALLAVLGTGGTAYITKRILDEKSREQGERKLDVPRVNRIVIKSSEDLTAEEVANPELRGTPQDIKIAQCLLAIHMDRLDSTAKVLDDPEVQAVLKTAGLSTRGLFKAAVKPTNEVADMLEKNPAATDAIVQKFLEKRPIVRGLAKVFKGTARRRAVRKANEMFGKKPVEPTKKAQVSPMGSLMTSIMGSQIAATGLPQDIARAVTGAKQQAEEEQAKEESPAKVVRGIHLEGADPAARAYLAANREKILKILERLAAQGKI